MESHRSPENKLSLLLLRKNFRSRHWKESCCQGVIVTHNRLCSPKSPRAETITNVITHLLGQGLKMIEGKSLFLGLSLILTFPYLCTSSWM